MSQNTRVFCLQIRTVASVLIRRGRFRKILDLCQGSKIGVPSGCLEEISIFKITLADVTL